MTDRLSAVSWEHNRAKRACAHRAALAARALVYNESSLVFRGPVPKNVQIMPVQCSHTGCFPGAGNQYFELSIEFDLFGSKGFHRDPLLPISVLSFEILFADNRTLGSGNESFWVPASLLPVAGDSHKIKLKDTVGIGATAFFTSEPVPRAVRYAHGDFPTGILYNAEGLPVAPFVMELPLPTAESTRKTSPSHKGDDSEAGDVAAAVVFKSATRTPAGDYFPCMRIPSAVRLPGTDTVLAFAEARRWVGDQCCPVPCCGPSATNESCPVPRGQPRCSGGCRPQDPQVSAGSAEIDSVDTTDRYVCLRISTDGGQSFGALQPNITGMRSNNPTSLISPSGKDVMLFFNDARKICTAEIARGEDCGGVWLTRSSDGGTTWNQPRKVFPADQSTPCPRGRFCSVPSIVGPGTSAARLPSGRIAVALYSHYSPPTAHSTGIMTAFATSLIYSDDDAKTWKQSNATLPFLGEPQLVHVPTYGKHALMLNARCADRLFYSKGYSYPSPCDAQTNGSGGHRGVALSTDGGASFSDAVYPSDLASPGCQGSTLLLTDGTVAYSGDDSRTSRMNMTLKRSAVSSQRSFPPRFDSGKLLTPSKFAGVCHSSMVTPCGSGYSALFEAKDGAVGVLWEGGDLGGRCNGSSCSIMLSLVD